MLSVGSMNIFSSKNLFFIIPFLLSFLLHIPAFSGEVSDAPFLRGASALEKEAIQPIFCDEMNIGTGVHIGAGLVMWAQHSRQVCRNKGATAGFGWKEMRLLFCDGSLDFCISKINNFDSNSKLARSYIAISLARPRVNQVLRSIGFPGARSSLRVSTGPVLRFDDTMSTSSSDGNFAYNFRSVWRIAVSCIPGNSNSPSLDAQGNMVLFANTGKNDNVERSIQDLIQNPGFASGGIEGAAIAEKLLNSNMREAFCRTSTSLYACR